MIILSVVQNIYIYKINVKMLIIMNNEFNYQTNTCTILLWWPKRLFMEKKNTTILLCCVFLVFNLYNRMIEKNRYTIGFKILVV